MTKYSKKAQKRIKRAMREYKKGELRSGVRGTKVKSRKQAEAIGISEARAKRYKVPAKRSTKR